MAVFVCVSRRRPYAAMTVRRRHVRHGFPLSDIRVDGMLCCVKRSSDSGPMWPAILLLTSAAAVLMTWSAQPVSAFPAPAAGVRFAPQTTPSPVADFHARTQVDPTVQPQNASATPRHRRAASITPSSGASRSLFVWPDAPLFRPATRVVSEDGDLVAARTLATQPVALWSDTDGAHKHRVRRHRFPTKPRIAFAQAVDPITAPSPIELVSSRSPQPCDSPYRVPAGPRGPPLSTYHV